MLCGKGKEEDDLVRRCQRRYKLTEVFRASSTRSVYCAKASGCK